MTLYVGYGMNDVDDVCQVGGQKNKTDRGAETISNPLEETRDGERAKGESAEALEQVRWL